MSIEKRKSALDLHVLTECALMIALATVLSLVKLYEAPFGGAVTLLSMAPIIVISMRHGVGVGLATGFVHSVIQLVLGLANVAWVPDLAGKVLCILLDYILPFTMLGLGGIFREVKFSKNARTNVIVSALLGTLLVTILRFGCHILSGVVIWYVLDLEWYADDPTHIVNRYSKWMFSLVYNGWYMVPEIIETAVGTPLIAAALMKVKLPSKKAK
jgi:thiamine transporter